MKQLRGCSSSATGKQDWVTSVCLTQESFPVRSNPITSHKPCKLVVMALTPLTVPQLLKTPTYKIEHRFLDAKDPKVNWIILLAGHLKSLKLTCSKDQYLILVMMPIVHFLSLKDAHFPQQHPHCEASSKTPKQTPTTRVAPKPLGTTSNRWWQWKGDPKGH